jgi:hypothetical protein
MDDVLLSQVLKRLEYLYSEPSDQAERNALEVVVLDKLIQVNGKELERDNKVLPEHHVVLYPDYVERVVRI